MGKFSAGKITLFSETAAPAFEAKYKYNSGGDLAEYWQREGDQTYTARWEYDKQGKPHKTYHAHSNDTFESVIEYVYDDYNCIVLEKSYNYRGNEKFDFWETSYKYDYLNRVIQENREEDGLARDANLYKFEKWDWPVQEIKRDDKLETVINYTINELSDGYQVKSDSIFRIYNLNKQLIKENIFDGASTTRSFEATFDDMTGLLTKEESYNGSYTETTYYEWDNFNNWIAQKVVISKNEQRPYESRYTRIFKYH